MAPVTCPPPSTSSFAISSSSITTIKAETQEWWKNGQLVGLKTKCSDNGKKTDVTAALENNTLHLRVNGLDRFGKNESWTTSFWKLADAKFHNKTIPIIECDSGKEFTSVLKYIDTQQLKIGAQLQDCYHFRVSAAPGRSISGTTASPHRPPGIH